MKTRVLAIILALCMVIAQTPAAVLAAPAHDQLVRTQAVPEVVEAERVGQMPALPASGEYKITAKVVKNSSRGEVELDASSADAGEYVFLLANPDDGYLVEFGGTYNYVNQEMKIEYIGLDGYLITMPDGDVNLEISFVKAPGSNHAVNLDVTAGGTAAVSRKSAKEGESVILQVTPAAGYQLYSVNGTYGDGEPALGMELGDQDGTYYFEISMPGADLDLTVEFMRNGPYSVSTMLDCNPRWGGVTVSHSQAYAGDKVTVNAIPTTGYQLAYMEATCQADGSAVSLTAVGKDQYTFTMPDGPVKLVASFEPRINSVSVVVDTGLGGTASVNVSEAQEGTLVTLTCIPDEFYRVAQITGAEYRDNGDNTYSVLMPGEALELHVLFLRLENPFLDVNETNFFHDPVLWAVENGITNGIDDTHFGPLGMCNRAQVVTFLWRAAGCPTSEAENPFTDVPTGTWYTDAVLWAVENGITNGLTPTTFGPSETCNRAQVVTFLWRAYGSVAPTVTKNPFTDVPEGEFYHSPVLWALENGITTGATKTTFDPSGKCMRAHVVTFLYRAAQLESEQ